MPGLLDPLTPQQQRLIDLVAEAVLADDDGGWPIFDYIEGTFDQAKEDAAETLASFPRVGRWGYGSVWWIGIGQLSPARETEVELTLVGMYHSQALRPVVASFFKVIDLMVAMRRATPLSRRKPRDLSISDDDVKQLLALERRLGTLAWWGDLLYKVMAREPSTFATGASRHPDGSWTKEVPRGVDEYEGITTIEEYVARIERLTALPQTPLSPAAPSPLDLVLSLDYLDVVWRVEHERHLFNYLSAERTAKLVLPANTPEEFDSRLSALGQILRSANANAKAAAGSKLASATHDEPLAPLEDYLVARVDAAAEERIRRAVTELEHALAIRDAAQHVEAGDRAVRALEAFGIGYPIPDFPRAWETVTTRVVEALGAIREELAAAFA